MAPGRMTITIYALDNEVWEFRHQTHEPRIEAEILRVTDADGEIVLFNWRNVAAIQIEREDDDPGDPVMGEPRPWWRR